MTLAEDLAKKRTRLENYYKQEEKMLTGGVQQYGIGSRSLQRYQMDLSNIRSTIKELEQEIKVLERKTSGRSANRSFSVVPTDW